MYYTVEEREQLQPQSAISPRSSTLTRSSLIASGPHPLHPFQQVLLIWFGIDHHCIQAGMAQECGQPAQVV